jgi:SsrA-binding protein
VLIGSHIAPLSTASTHVRAEPDAHAQAPAPPRGDQPARGQGGARGLHAAPLNLHYKAGRIKLEIGLAKGKKQHDKRQSIKEREWNREQQRLVRNRTGSA